MTLYLVERRLRVILRRALRSRAFPAVVAAFSFAAALSMTMPVAPIMILSVLLRRRRWLPIALAGAIGSALGGVALYYFFNRLGWAQIAAMYPDLSGSEAWREADAWLSAYGLPALFAIAVSPFPQTPALIFTALHRLPIAEVFLALITGKALKYGLYASVVARFPDFFRHRMPRAWSP
jgi:membrane protein YqaA with SNARE-associated domain